MQVVLQLARNCNLACDYCYQSHRAGAAMSPEVVERTVRWLLDAGHAHIALTYFGGEPLLARDTIEATLPKLAEWSRERGALITAKISTNGYLLDEDFCRLANEHMLFVSLSTDGGHEAQDSGRPTRGGGPTSHRIERALSLLVQTRTPFATYSVITPHNVRFLPRSIDWLFERGSRILVSTPDFAAEWTASDLDRLERGYRALARRYVRWTRSGIDFILAPFDSKIAARTQARLHRAESCGAGVRQLAIDPEGYIYPCIQHLESSDGRIGHIDTGVDQDAWSRLDRRIGGTPPAVCGACGIRERCASGCACLNLRTTGRAREVDGLLCAHERLVTRAADRIGEHLWRRKDRAFIDRQFNPRHHAFRAVERLLEEARR